MNYYIQKVMLRARDGTYQHEASFEIVYIPHDYCTHMGWWREHWDSHLSNPSKKLFNISVSFSNSAMLDFNQIQSKKFNIIKQLLFIFLF